MKQPHENGCDLSFHFPLVGTLPPETNEHNHSNDNTQVESVEALPTIINLPPRRSRPRGNDGTDHTTERSSEESNPVYVVDANLTEVVLEVIGERVPVYIELCGIVLCRKPKMPKCPKMPKILIPKVLLLCIIFAIVSITTTTVTTVTLRFLSQKKLANSMSLLTSSSAPSPEPSFSPLGNDDRSKNIVKVLHNVSGDCIYDPESPQGKALRWILKNDEMKLNHNSSNIFQRYSLMVVFYSLNGPKWGITKGYGSGLHECDWYGVAECQDGKIYRIDFTNNILQGTIPDEISMITSLIDLRVGYNRIGGTIPIGFTTFDRLIIKNNKFTGTIPNLLRAVRFEAQRNMLTGTISSFLLRGSYVSLFDNHLKGPLPQIVSPLPRLVYLNINNNDLFGMIPSDIGLLTGLKVLNLGENNLSGTIPRSIGNLSHLEELYLYGNVLSGRLPSEFGLLSQLQYLQLQDTMITGLVPESVCQLTNSSLVDFEVDCKSRNGGLDCSCCTYCY